MLARIVLTVAACCVLAGCGAGYGRDLDGLTLAAGFYPLAWAAEEIGGARVAVVNVTPAGAEPHDLELSARGVELIRSANYVFLLRGFQPALDRAADGADDARVVDFLPDSTPRATGGETDPHVWLDPVRFAAIVDRMGGELGHPGAAERLAASLRELDRDYRQGLERCERRELVTSHAAFGYLAERYGLEQIAITGLAPDAEPTAGDLEDVVDEVREHGATTIFVEPLVSPRVAETVAREVGASTAVLNPIEGLTEEEARSGATYLTVMRSNLEALREALGCR